MTHKAKLGLTAAIVIFLSTVTYGASLDAYRSKVDSAAKRGAEVEQKLRDDEFDDASSREFVEQMYRDLPPTERVEWFGGSVDVSHEWLRVKVKEFVDESDPEKKLPIAVAIREYLSALSFKLHELQEAVASSRTKDEDKQKLAEILRREEYQKPQTGNESAFQRWLREFLEWLMDLWPRSPVPNPDTSGIGALGSILRILLYAALIIVVGFLVFKIAPMLFPKLKRVRKPKSKRRTILGEQIQDDQGASDLFGEAERLAREGDLRGAIRKGYIALLCDLSDRRIIGLARNKTNRDYLRDVRARRELHPRMQSVTEIFERHWYGSQKSEERDWVRFTEEYNEAIRSV